MNQYVMSQLPGGIECYGEQDRYLKFLDVKDWVLAADSDETLAIDEDPVVTLSVPSDAEFAKLTNNGPDTIYYTTSGTTPSGDTGVGAQLAANASAVIYGAAMETFQAVTATGDDAAAYVEYFSA